MPTLPRARAESYLPALQAAMSEFEISHTTRRAAAFLSQIGHESADLRYWSEIWGPTPAQTRYEGRSDLGNLQPGDGKRYRGRGPIQLTGRANYRYYGELLDAPLETQPELAATPAYGFRIAGLYWKLRRINVACDAGDFAKVTRLINGGMNGHADRLTRYHRCLEALK